MSTARGAAGALKPKLHNVNSVYAGKSHNAVKAPGLGKHGGLQSLGKTTAVVRRMPPPATLPSLRAESQGQDPNVALVPQGGSGWHKENVTANNGSTSESSALSKPLLTASGDLSQISSSNVVGNSLSHTTDLRPTWAKQTSAADLQAAAQQNVSAAAALGRDFPSLAAATATTGKQSNAKLTDSLKPQKSGSWRAGGSSALSKNEGDNTAATSQPQYGGGSYSASTALGRAVERQLPSRYYDGSVTPPSPPLGTFTVPKLPPAVTPQLQSTVTSGKITEDEGLEIEQKKSAVQVCHQSQPSNATNACATNVNVPPPNYCLPPPNCQQNQETVPPKGSIIPVSSTKCEKVAAEDIEKSVHQRNGHGDGGCGDRTQNANKYDDRYGNLMNKNPPSYQGYPAMRSSDVRLCGGRESLNDRSKMENGDMYLRSEEAEWQGTQYAVTDRDLENRRWRSGGDGGQSVGPVPLMSVNTSQIGLAYNREREEEAGRRQNVEREAAIERSRQKRRIVNQGMMTQECESGDQPQYGSLRDNDTFSEVDRPASTCSFGQTSQESACVMIRQEQAQQKWNMDGSGQVENYVDCGSSRHDGRFEQLDRILQQHQQSEYRMLRRPDSKDSAEINLQISNMSIHGEEEDELQLTKLSLPVPKVIKRVAPAPLSLQAAGPGSDQSTGIQDGGHAQRGYQLDRNQEKRNNQQRMHQREKRAQRNHADMNSLQNSNSNLQTIRGIRPFKPTDEVRDSPEGERQNHQPQQTKVVIPPPPADNVWEKRAEERESAERERAAQRDMMQQQLRMQQFPIAGEQPVISGFVDDLNDNDDQVAQRGRGVVPRSDGTNAKQGSNRTRNSNRGDRNAMHSYGLNDICGGEEDEENGQPFRGQREFVNSRVFSRSSRGMSVGGNRGGRMYGRGTFSAMRRGTSVPYVSAHGQPLGAQFGDRHDRQRRSKRQEEIHSVQETDKFANMGEFRVEDTYGSGTSMRTKVPSSDEGGGRTESSRTQGERRGSRQQRPQRSSRAQQPLYQPRQADEGGRMDRGNRASVKNQAKRGSDIRNTNQGQLDRGKRKREPKDEDGVRQHRADGSSTVLREEGVRKGNVRSSHQQKNRTRRQSPVQGSGVSAQNAVVLASDRAGQLKSPVTSEGQEEWETASESSDIVGRVGAQRRQMASAKQGGHRKINTRSNNVRRGNTGLASIRTGSSSKNAKPASTTSHAAARGLQPLKEEAAAVESSIKTRDACKDGLAGVDINNAGVIVIDDRPDDHGDGISENGDDFEEVLSKKSKRLRQQQINEQHEAEERRKMREREKIEKRKARQQARRLEKKSLNRDDKTNLLKEAVANSKQNTNAVPKCEELCNGTKKPGSMQTQGGSESSVNQVIGSPGVTVSGAQNTLNTTVWNSSIVKEQVVRRSSPTLDNHPVIPSPIARPTPKTNTASISVNVPSTNNTCELWAKMDADERQRNGAKIEESVSSAKTSSVEFAANFSSQANRTESNQYEFAFDPSLNDEPDRTTSKPSPKDVTAVEKGKRSDASLSMRALYSNDDKRLKEKLDKVKDIWPGQQFGILEGNEEADAISTMTSDKSQPSTAAHGPNVAKVRPQPQSNEQTVSPQAPLKESASNSSVPTLPPPSPVACIPPGAYLQSLSQIPPPTALPQYSMMFGEPYGPHSTTSPPSQTLFGGTISANQTASSRSRPPSFIEQSPVFIHPPPSATAPNSLTWSNSNHQIELLAGISATPPLPAQPGNPVQRFQFSGQPRSTSAFGGPPPLINGGAKLAQITGPPPHPHQIPPPLHPHSFIAPPPEFLPQMQNNGLGAVGSQRPGDASPLSCAAENIPRGRVSVLGQVPLSHLPQQFGFSQQSQSTFQMSAATSFSQAPPPIHAFAAPPPPLRYPPGSVPPLNNDAAGVITAGWGKSTLNPQVPLKYANGGSQQLSVGRSSFACSQQYDRWTVQVGTSNQYPNSLIYHPTQTMIKENTDALQSNVDRYTQRPCANVGQGISSAEAPRTSSAESVPVTSPSDNIENSAHSKKATKV